MKLKTTHTQLECLCRLLNASLQVWEPTDNMEVLIMAHMKELHKKLVKRFVDQRKEYTIDFPDVTAIAFYEFFQSVNVQDLYGRNIVNGILTEIDKNNLVKSI